MEKQGEAINLRGIDNVAKIVDWKQLTESPRTYRVTVIFRDGTEHSYKALTANEWDRIQHSEQMADLDEANAPSMEKVEHRNPHPCDDPECTQLHPCQGCGQLDCICEKEDGCGCVVGQDHCPNCVDVIDTDRPETLDEVSFPTDALLIPQEKEEAHRGLPDSLPDDLSMDSRLDYYHDHPTQFHLCVYCRSYWCTKSGNQCLPKVDDDSFELIRANRFRDERCGACSRCKEQMLRSKGAHAPGTVVKVGKVDDSMVGGFGDVRNEGRIGTIERVIVDLGDVEHVGQVLYEIKFADGYPIEPRHWMDVEGGLANGNSAHFHSELVKI